MCSSFSTVTSEPTAIVDSTLGGGLNGVWRRGASDPEWEMRLVLTKCQSGGFKVRVVWGPACVLEGLEGKGTFPLHANGWDEGVRVGMAFLVVGPGGQRHGGREGPDASWEIPAVKGLEHPWSAALVCSSLGGAPQWVWGPKAWQPSSWASGQHSSSASSCFIH